MQMGEAVENLPRQRMYVLFLATLCTIHAACVEGRLMRRRSEPEERTRKRPCAVSRGEVGDGGRDMTYKGLAPAQAKPGQVRIPSGPFVWIP